MYVNVCVIFYTWNLQQGIKHVIQCRSDVYHMHNMKYHRRPFPFNYDCNNNVHELVPIKSATLRKVHVALFNPKKPV